MSVTKTYFITIFIALGVIFAFLFYKTDVFISPQIVNAQVWQCNAGATQCSGSTRQVCVTDGCNGDFSCWKSHNTQTWCDVSDYYHTCINGSSTSTGECCGSSCQGGGTPDDPGSVYVSSRNGSSATVCNTFNHSVSIGVNRCQKNYDEPQVCSEVKYAAVCAPASEDIGAGSPSSPNCKGVNVGIPGCGVWQLDISYNGSSLYGESGCNFDSCDVPRPPNPEPPVPVGVCSIEKDKITYSWSAVSNADFYSVRYNAYPRDDFAANVDAICAAGRNGLNGDYCFDTTDLNVTFNAPVNQANDFWVHSRINSNPLFWSEPANINDKLCVKEIDSTVMCKSLTGKVIGTGKFIGQTPQLSELPNDFTGVITLTCTSESKPKAVNKMEFTFFKDTVEQKKTVNTNIDCSENVGVFSCSGKATFDVTGSASYSARSKVCIVDGTNETCSP